jgi:hypothetical protein
MSTTPRTDDAKEQYLTGKMGIYGVLDETRRLETELAHLNDEVERLKKDNLDMGHWIGSKMYEPEWDSFKKSLEIIDHWKARVKKTEAALDVMTTELGKMFLSAAERADRNVELRRRAEKAEAEVSQLTDALDMMKDEFMRIIASPNCTSEIKDFASRAQLKLVQRVPVITQRDRAEAELAAEREKVRVLRDALENLRDEQNGAPLCTREEKWKQAMDKADAALAQTKEVSK